MHLVSNPKRMMDIMGSSLLNPMIMHTRSFARFYLFLIIGLVSPATIRAACDLRIMSAGPCLADGKNGIPHVGENYGVKVIVNITGAPTRPFRIKWTLANVTHYFDNINARAGNYWWYFNCPMDLDDPIPWSVTLDPDGISGDTNRANNTASGTFTPVPPSAAVELYAPRMMTGSQRKILTFQLGSGTISNLYVVFGVPTTHGAQKAISVSGPVNGRKIYTSPNDVPVFEVARLNVPAACFEDIEKFTVQLYRVRVNSSLLRKATWADMDGLAPEWKRWLAPDRRIQSSDPRIAAFVRQSLPENYRAVLTPYDTARTLHRAVMKKLKYETPHRVLDAVGVLELGATDCGGFAGLLTACLRSVGIPARCISGFREGDGIVHVRLEFHLPGADWLVADPTDGHFADPTGTYAYSFGNCTNAEGYVAVDVGDSHLMPYADFPFIQMPNCWWNGGAAGFHEGTQLFLRPGGTLAVSSAITPPPGLVSWWPGDGRADDVRGTNHGTMCNGAGYGDGGVDKSFSFDGVKGLASAPTQGLPTGNDNRTLELWAMIRSLVNDEAFFAGYGGFGNQNQAYELGAVNTAAGSRVMFSQWGNGLTGPVMTTDKWHHVAVTNQGNLVTLYLDGDAVATGSMVINTPSISRFYIGKIAGSAGDTRRLNGCVDEVAIYERALNAAEINGIYQAGRKGKKKSGSALD
jgi:transglutaminase-like putative cysteine protease